MRLQSSLEFLTTYSFLFLIIGVILSFLFFFASAPKASIPNQCIAFSGPSCNLANYYVNLSQRYSLVSFSFTNPGPVPINVINMTVLVNTANSFASGCIPNVVYPGGTFTCVAAMARAPSIGGQVNGYYSYNALYCNSGIANLQNNCTGGLSVQYGGSFTTSAQNSRPLIFSVIAAAGPSASQFATFPANPTAIPSGWSRVQNGQWTSTIGNAGLSSIGGYAFATRAYQSGVYYGLRTSPFPVSVSYLNTNGVAASCPCNSVMSLAYTVIYEPPGAPSSPSVSIWTNDQMQVYYYNSLATWATVWPTTQNLAAVGPVSVPTTNGINYIATIWTNVAGDGLQVFSINGFKG